MNFFDFLNAINVTKQDLIKDDPQSEKEYVPFMVNRGLSYFHDTIMYANEMNKYASVPKKWQFDFYRNSIPKKKRFSKWHKKDQNSDDLNLVMNAYNYSSEKAAVALEILTDEQIKNLRDSYSQGGR